MNSAASSLRCLARRYGRASALARSRRCCSCGANCGRAPSSALIAKRCACHVSRRASAPFVVDGQQQLSWPAAGDHPARWSSRYSVRRAFHSCHTLRSNPKDESNSSADGPVSSAPSIDEQPQLGESFTDVPGATNTQSKKLAIIYTCKVCSTRSAKQFTEQAYKHGVVLVRCPGCQNLHLIADRLGWFEEGGEDGEGWDVEKVLAKAGENVKAVSGEDVLELTLDDVMGKKRE